jgi:hypothetical protein
MAPTSTQSNNIGQWVLAVTASLLGVITLAFSGNLARIVLRGGIESAQWQFGLIPLFPVAIAFAITAGNAITHRPPRFPKFIIPALLACNAVPICFLLLRFKS